MVECLLFLLLPSMLIIVGMFAVTIDHAADLTRHSEGWMIWSSNVVYLFLLFIYVIVGMFAVTTDHAADSDLARHSEGWMIWSSNAVYLAWLGFSDCHSQIDYYKVTVGSTYMANDLTKVSKLLL